MNDVRDRFIWICVASYAVLALLWIFLSDQLLSIFTDVGSIVWLSTAKGVFFVVTTAAGFLLALHSVPSAENNNAQHLQDVLASGFSPGRLPLWLTSLFAMFVTLAMLWLREELSVDLDTRPLMIMCMFPIIFSAMLGGLVPGLISTAIAALGVLFGISPATNTFHIGSGLNLLQWGFLIINGVVVSLLSEVLRRSRIKAETSHRLLDAIISGTADAVFVKDAKGRYLLINAAAAGFVGKSPKDILGCDDFALFPQESAQYLMTLDQVILASGQTQTHEEQLLTHDGKTMVFLATKGPVLDKSGQLIGLFGISRDITERKRIEDEVRRLNTELEQRVALRTAELNAANLELEDLTYALAHNLRAPVRAIDGFTQLLTEAHAGQANTETGNHLEQIKHANRIMGTLIDGILTLLRCSRGVLRRETVDISALTKRVFDSLACAEPQRRVMLEVEPGLVATGDAAMLETVMSQLLENAWKFTRNQAHARIRVSSGEINGHPGICISDNGAGFDLAHAEQLYQPFYRLHRQDEFPGIGIGLATARRIIHRHGGQIHAVATPGTGATFCFSLPQTADVENHHEE